MKKNIKLLSISLIVLLFTSCGGGRSKGGETPSDNLDSLKAQTVSLRQEWFPNSNYCGAVFAKNKFAKLNNIDINIVAGSDNVDPVKMVMSGENDFGDAGADRVLEAIGKGAELVIIGVVNLNSPTCFISKKEKNITSPMDFQNHSVGVLTGTSTEYVYKALVRKFKLKNISEKEAPFDLQTFILGQYDVRPAFIYDEPISLDMKNIKYNIIEPKNYGISFLGTVYFTRKELVKNNPKLVQSFINSVADGWSATLTYPETAIDLLLGFDKTLDKDREYKSLLKGKEYYQGKDTKILWADMSDWQGMVKILQDLGTLEKINLETAIDNTFLETYHNNKSKKQTGK